MQTRCTTKTVAPAPRPCLRQGPCGQNCGQDVKQMCSSHETIHKNLFAFGNFVLSLCANRASIDLHVKAPDNGGCGPLRELRLKGDAVWGACDLRVLGSDRTATVSRELRFPAALAGSAFGPDCGKGSGLRVGDRVASAALRRRRGLLGRIDRSSGAEGFFGGCPSGTESRVALQISV
jgi:hypothetical protein